MSDAAALLEAIRREPDDDAPRLKYADFLQGAGDPERAEFIRLQIEVEHLPRGTPEHARRIDRASELLLRNARAWTLGYEGPIPDDAEAEVALSKVSDYSELILTKGRRSENPLQFRGKWAEFFSFFCFRRGFVETVPLTPSQFFAIEPCAFRPTGPLPTLYLEMYAARDPLGTLANFVERLAAAPLLEQFRGLDLAAGFGGTTAEGLYILATLPALMTRLVGLRVSEDCVGETAIRAVLESPLVTRLRGLSIDGNGCTPAIVDLLLRADRFRGMTSMYLGDVYDSGAGLRPFAVPGRWPRLENLSFAFAGFEDLSLRGLMRPGAFPRLDCLDLAGNGVHFAAVRDLLLSGAFPRLRVLGVGVTSLTHDDVQALRDEFGSRVEIFYPLRRFLHRGPLPP